MFFMTLLSLFIVITIAFVIPLVLINAVLPLYLGLVTSVFWSLCALIWFFNSSEWVLQAFHSKKLSFGKRVESYIDLESFFDARSRMTFPSIYVQKFSLSNPFLVLVRGAKYTFLLSDQFYRLLNDEQFSSLLGISQQKLMIIPFWVASKVLALKLLYIQFFSSYYYQVSKIKGTVIKTITRHLALCICYLTLPLFLVCGWAYSRIWTTFIKHSIKKHNLSEEVWEKLEFILRDDNQMSLLGYLLGTGHGEVRAHPLVNI